MALAPGARLGPYEITAQIGAGGMGEVYRAKDSNLGRDVAIKVLPETFARDPERLARFEREAKMLASLNHPNIAIIHGLEKADPSRGSGQAVRALVMELVEGETLADRISRGPIPVDEALLIARQIAEALEAAHDQGIIHRDLKPANVKVRPDGTVKVLDFGLAKALEPAGAIPTNVTQSPTITSPALMTGVGVLLGTAAYMSPEQARGKPADKRADIWAFGCMMYEMLTGRRAFAGDEVSDVLASVLAREPDWTVLPHGLSPVLGAFLRRCLHKDRKQRIGDAQSVRLALEGAFETTAPDVARPVVVRQPLWRRAIPIAATAVGAVLLTGLAAWSRWPRIEPHAVSRFKYDVPPDQVFRGDGRPVMALSPDGRHFVYNTTSGLYLRAMGELNARLIPGTESRTGQAIPGLALTGPFFAPDGESVGYFENGQLKRIRTSGGAAFVICAATPSFGASWGADNTILFGQATGVMRVSANGGTPHLVIPAKEGELVFGPQLLPDGDSVLFSVTTASGVRRWDAAQIVVQSLSSGAARKRVLQGGNDARYVHTGHLVYAVGDALFAVPFDLGRGETRGSPVFVVEGIVRARDQAAQTPAANYGVSDRGTLVYLGGTSFERTVPLGTLVWVDRHGREERLDAPPHAYNSPRLSPDGTRIALEVGDENPDVWIWEIGRRSMTKFTSDPAIDGLPVWSPPDGQRLVWASNRGGALVNLYWQAANGTGTVERLTESPNSQRPSSFTPDGRRLLLAEASPGRNATGLSMLSLDGDRRVTRLTPLTPPTAASEINPEISPDGRWLAYESNESGRDEIWVRPFPAVDQGRWHMSTNGGREPVWARKGPELFYLAPDGTLMGVPVTVGVGGATFAAGAPAALIAGGAYLTQTAFHRGRTYDVSADGTRFLRIKVNEGSRDTSGAPRHFVIVQNWFEEVKRVVPTQ
jgi:serine/threonine-protein kinase